MNHFKPECFTFPNSGKIHLKTGAVPTEFNIVPIVELDEDLNQTDLLNNNTNDSRNEPNAQIDQSIESSNESKLDIENIKLRKELEQIKRQMESEKIFANSKIDYLRQIISKDSKEIQALKKRAATAESEIDQIKRPKRANVSTVIISILSF